MRAPRNFHLWNRAHRGAYLKGVKARQEGKALEDCPYVDRRKWNGRLTWARSFIAAWRDGWSDENNSPDNPPRFPNP